jgi:hypothetical protein
MKTAKNTRIRILALVLAAALTAAFVAPELTALAAPDTSALQITGDGNTVVFIDVGADYWAYNDIRYAAEQGIVSGYPDGSFKPGGGVTREEYCKMMVLTFQAPIKNPSEPTFTDVVQSRWSYGYIETCKEFLTGYKSPFGDSMTFHPSEAATREDIAVALVKIMGLSVGKDYDYASQRFSDIDAVSPNMRPYVSKAAEQGLINGYPDGTFGPQRGITRAETVALLNRATKASVGDATEEMQAELQLGVTVATDSDDPKNITLYIFVEQNTKVTVDGQSVRIEEGDYNGDTIYYGICSYSFKEEGEKTFTIVGTKGTKTKTITETAKYEIGVPVLNVNQGDQSVAKKTFSLSGSISDSNYSVTLTMNGKSVSVNSYDGSWSESVTLNEGANTYTFVATNTAGKSVTKTVTITLDISGPQLTVVQSNTTVTNKTFSFSGSVSDSNYGVSLTMNGEVITNYSGSWTKNVTLKEGENVYKFVAMNSAGKSVEKTVVITFDVGGPQLTVVQSNTTVTNKAFSFSGSVSDSNYSVSLMMNGEVITNYSGSWTKNVTLKEGENVYKFVATNAAGKSVEKTVTITLTADAPTITFINCPEATSQSSLNIIGNIGGDRTGVYLFVNDQQWTVSYDGSFQKTVTLQEGVNTFVFRAVNSSGKEVTVTKTVTYTAI